MPGTNWWPASTAEQPQTKGQRYAAAITGEPQGQAPTPVYSPAQGNAVLAAGAINGISAAIDDARNGKPGPLAGIFGPKAATSDAAAAPAPAPALAGGGGLFDFGQDVTDDGPPGASGGPAFGWLSDMFKGD